MGTFSSTGTFTLLSLPPHPHIGLFRLGVAQLDSLRWWVGVSWEPGWPSVT